MTPKLPSFLRRRLYLSEARRALLGGEPEVALQRLTDPSLALSDDADRLRERTLDVMCREAARHHAEGRSEETDRLLGIVVVHDERRAGLWRRRLEGEGESRSSGPTSGLTPAAESGIIGALEQLLEQMRDERTRSGSRRRPTASSTELRAAESDSGDGRAKGAAENHRFHLAVDDVGEFLVAYGSEITIGHARAEQADLGLLADLDPLHVRLYRTESFHAGPAWRIEAIAKQRIAIGGQLVDPGGAALGDGDEVQLSTNLAFRFRRPHPASGSVLLELLHGAECEGARRILLLSPGEAGRIQMSASRGRHLRVPRLKEEVAVWIDDEELVIESRAQLAAPGADAAIQQPGDHGPGGLRIPCPPARRIDFTVGSATRSGPPFSFSVRPIEGTRSGEGWR